MAFDEFLFHSFAGFFEKNELFLKNQLSLYTESFGRNSIYIKEFLTNVKTKLNERNITSSEYYKAKIALNDKKNKTILMENSQWGITREHC